MAKEKILFLFTDAYPCKGGSNEYVFLENEIEELSKGFAGIRIFPRNLSHDRCELPGKVICDEQFAKFFQNRSWRVLAMFFTLFAPNAWREFAKQKSYGLTGFIKILSWLSTAHYTRQFLMKYRELADKQDVICYSYWCHGVALGLVMAKKKVPFKAVSRAHGFDLYREASKPQFHPFREKVLGELDQLFLISRNGIDYLKREYPEVEGKYSLQYLGVSCNENLPPRSYPSQLVFVSCSTVNANKRVHLIGEAISLHARKNPSQRIKWIHLGDGPEMKYLKQACIDQLSCKSLEIDLKGHCTNQQVLQVYLREDPVAFINTSRSEGVPVSIMEAMSCAIPVIAPQVGGIDEIVTGSNGVLLAADFSVEDLQDALQQLTADKAMWEEKSAQAFNQWKSQWNAKKNSEEFARELRNL